MLFKLSLRNLSHSIRDYAVYFITLILGVMVFYLFNALDSQSVLAMVGSSSYDGLSVSDELFCRLYHGLSGHLCQPFPHPPAQA